MAYREVTMIEVKEVLRQWLSGLPRKAMARWVGLDRNTIRRYIQVAQQCGLRDADGVDALTDEKLSEVLLPAPAEPYEVPLRATPKVHRDQHAMVAKAIYSFPRHFVGKTLEAIANRTTVRFYENRLLVKTHPRKPPGGALHGSQRLPRRAGRPRPARRGLPQAPGGAARRGRGRLCRRPPGRTAPLDPDASRIRSPRTVPPLRIRARL